MKSRSWRAGLVAASVLFTAATSRGQQVPPVFRATAELVSVDVSVRDSGSPVLGLTNDDFVMLDNKVHQRIETVDTARLPLDVTVVVDVSGGPPQWFGTPRPASSIAEDLGAIINRTSAALRSEDRVRLLTVDAYASEVVPLGPVSRAVTVPASIATAGKPSLHDALIAALLQPVEPDRRHLVIAVTKGEDTISAVEFVAVQDVARRSEAVLHVVLGTSLVGDTTCELRKAPGAEGSPFRVNVTDSVCRFPRRQFWQPAYRSVTSQLPALAESTGGRFHGIDALGLHRNFSDEVRRIAEDFRQGYVLRYTPQGVQREGWHDVAVRVPSRPTAVVQARRGYSVDVVRPATSVEGSPSVPRIIPAGGATMGWLADAFAARQYQAFEAGVARAAEPARLLREVRTSESRWPATPRREAVFALELVIGGLNRSDNEAHEEAMRLLEQQTQLVRHPFGADRFECAWYWTGIAGLQGLIRPALAETFVARAIGRCPDEPRFHLAAAVVADQHWPVGTTRKLPRQTKVVDPGDAHRAKVTSLYEAAMQFPSTATEARVRAAWFALRIGEADSALRLINAAADTDEPHVRYMREFVRAQVLRDLGRYADAAAAYRQALTIWPGAQSARLALMALQVAHGDRAEGEALSEAIQTAPGNDTDPWWRYWQGDFRAYTAILAALREIAR
jgi:VWFA-related protein